MSNDLQVYQLPQLSAKLRAKVDSFAAGPRRFASSIPGEADLVLSRPVIYDPDAQPAADALRAAIAEKADPETIRDWLQTLAAGCPNPPASQREFNMRAAPILIACEELPAACWTKATLRAAIRAYNWWPSAHEILTLLQRHFDQMEADLRALDAIAKGERFSTGFREPPVPYELPPPPPERPFHPSSPRHGRGHDFDDMSGKSTSPAVPPMRTVEQQRAEFDIPETDLLAARRAKFAPPATDDGEGGGPALRLVK